MNNLIIRKRKIKDFPQLIKITKNSFPFWFKHIPYLLFPTIVAEKDSQAIGFIVISTKVNIGRIDLMAMDRNYRGQNIGEELLKEVFSRFKKQEKKYCLSKVRVNNPKALNFYQKYGFKVQKILKRSILGDVSVIKKELK